MNAIQKIKILINFFSKMRLKFVEKIIELVFKLQNRSVFGGVIITKK